jgi:decaprenyl-diphosphate synthase subunit 1
LAVQFELRQLKKSVEEALLSENEDVRSVACYYFDGKGKYLRPSLVLLMSKLCQTLAKESDGPDRSLVTPGQYKIAVVSEMIHTASLVHDDVIDEADVRRSRPTVNKIWGNKKAILAGDYILAKATKLLASIGEPEVILMLAQVIEDLVKGEFMQLSAVQDVDGYEDQFASYLSKTFMKTASLFANSCRAVAYLSGASQAIQEMAYQYGRNVGLAFQLIDDTLDFVGDAVVLGKPAVADLKLGISTAPVLFAAEEHPELTQLMARRFKHRGDVEEAWDIVLKSDGIKSTRRLAEEHRDAAIKQLQPLPESRYRNALVGLAHHMTNRTK